MKFEISHRGGTAHEVELAGSVVVIGRDPGCDIVLNDPKCSRRHAVIEDGPEGIAVRDSGSANGISLNGRRVEQAPLRPGDVLRLGDTQVTLLGEAGATVVMASEDLDIPTPTPPVEPPDPALRPPPPPPPPSPARAGARPIGRVPAGPRPRPVTVSVLAILWAVFVPASVGACLLAVHRAGGGPLAWALGAVSSLVLAGLGLAMALGLHSLAPWARHLQFAIAAVGLVICPFTLAAATVLLYLTQPEVKAAFEERDHPVGGTADATFALSILGMLVLGAALTAIAVLVL
jgi:hypothetical protein